MTDARKPMKRRRGVKGVYFDSSDTEIEEDNKDSAQKSQQKTKDKTKKQSYMQQHNEKKAKGGQPRSEQEFEDAWGKIFNLDESERSTQSDPNTKMPQKKAPQRKKVAVVNEDLLSELNSSQISVSPQKKHKRSSDRDYEGDSEMSSTGMSERSRHKPQQEKSCPFLDEFIDDTVRKKAPPKRKAVPARKRVQETDTFLDFLDDIDNHAVEEQEDKDCDVTEAKSQRRKGVKGQEVTDESDLDDFFNDTSKWVKMKKTSHFADRDGTSQEAINTMIAEDEDSYDNMFKTGKMRKKVRK